MIIKFSDVAKAKIQEETTQSPDRTLKLKYDTEGCGCAVDGVPTLWLTKDFDQGDVMIDTNSIPIHIEKQEVVFFDDQMTIDFNESYHTFVLKSPNQMLNPRMKLVVS